MTLNELKKYLETFPKDWENYQIGYSTGDFYYEVSTIDKFQLGKQGGITYIKIIEGERIF